MRLSLKSRLLGDVIVIHCEGRIVYRDETAVFSRVVRQALQHTREVILDLRNVQAVDSAGLGELVLLHLWATSQEKALKLAGARRQIEKLLELTNLSSVMMMYGSVAEAMQSTPALPLSKANAVFHSLDA